MINVLYYIATTSLKYCFASVNISVIMCTLNVGIYFVAFLFIDTVIQAVNVTVCAYVYFPLRNALFVQASSLCAKEFRGYQKSNLMTLSFAMHEP